MRIADGVQFIARQNQQRVGALDLIEGVAERALQVVRAAARHQVHDDFGIAGGLENRAAMFERAAKLAGIGEIAIMRESEFAFVAVDDDWLGVDDGGIAGGGVAGMAYRGGAGQARQHGRQKNFLHQAHAFFEMQRSAVGRNDAGRFLTAMLQRVEAEVGELRRFGDHRKLPQRRNDRENGRRPMSWRSMERGSMRGMESSVRRTFELSSQRLSHQS